MLIAHADGDGKRAFILGLSRGNIERLLEGKPIKLTRASHGDSIPEGWEFLLLFGETEQAIANELRAAGAIGAQTKTIVDPRVQ